MEARKKLSIKKVYLIDLLGKILLYSLFLYFILNAVNDIGEFGFKLPSPLRSWIFWCAFAVLETLRLMWGRCPYCGSWETISMITDGIFTLPKRCIILCPKCGEKFDVK